jgi:hypothetical protein
MEAAKSRCARLGFRVACGAARAGSIAGVADRAEVVGAEPLAARGSMIEIIVSKKSFCRNYSDVGRQSASRGA